MTTDQLTRLRARAASSPALLRYTEAMAAFLIADRPGVCTPVREWDETYNAKNAAWDALKPHEREIVRAIEGER